MEKDWSTVAFDVVAYKDTGTYILKSPEEASQLLDDHIVMTQSMSFSPYKKAFEERISSWESKLRMTQVHTCMHTHTHTHFHTHTHTRTFLRTPTHTHTQNHPGTRIQTNTHTHTHTHTLSHTHTHTHTQKHTNTLIQTNTHTHTHKHTQTHTSTQAQTHFLINTHLIRTHIHFFINKYGATVTDLVGSGSVTLCWLA